MVLDGLLIAFLVSLAIIMAGYTVAITSKKKPLSMFWKAVLLASYVLATIISLLIIFG